MRVIKGKFVPVMLTGLTMLALLDYTALVRAQATSSMRVAIISDSKASVAADLLTAELSQQPNLQVLERDQIEKVYREQGLSTATKDYFRLGQVLGADGLLLLDCEEEAVSQPGATAARFIPSATAAGSKTNFLNVRLVAVQPGVVLAAERFTFGNDLIAEWARSYLRRLQPMLPKLAVLAKDAIPVSVVNLRSAVSSAEASEMERQLQRLAVQRLSREPQLFVLERQRLQRIGEEKELSADETAFWNGAWLLEGVVDQNSYSKTTITLNVKLTPAKGGKPAQFEASGSRTNLAEVINALAAKAVAALQITSAAEKWNAADEAAQFYAEAKWALRWDALAQAQAASDAAWALGKQDLDCAILRIRTRISQVPLVLPPGSSMYARGKRVNFVNINEPPDARFCDLAGQALERYAEFSRISPEGEPKVLTRGPGWNDWHNSEWYQLGIEVLEKASRVLLHFNYSPASQKAAADKLAELRSETRAVAQLIFNAPTVHGSYFVGNRIANHDELAHTMNGTGSIFASMLTWGCLWQEHPEDSVLLYKQLMESPVFCYIHDRFWTRDNITPRLVAWNENDRKRVPQVWKTFWDELNTSTNLLWRMEAKALVASESKDKALAQQAREEWWGLVRSNRAELVGNNVELFYLGWRFEFNAETEAMNREYWNKTIPAVKVSAAFEEQKKFLREHQPYEPRQFGEIFREKSYSQPQALELLPLIDAYKSNLLAKAQQADRSQKFFLESNARSLDVRLRRIVEKIAHSDAQPAPQQLAQSTQISTTSTSKPTRPAEPLKAAAKVSDAITNIILVKKFLEIPLTGLSPDTLTAIQISTHCLLSNKLVLDLQLGREVYSSDPQGKWQGTRYAQAPAIAILDTASERWRVIECAETDFEQRNQFYHHTALWHDSVFTSQGGKVRKFDLTGKSWVDLELPDIGNCGLFVVSNRLYAANHHLIAEVLEGGASLRILASNRRQPPASTLDSERLSAASGFVLHTPALSGDAAGRLRVITANKAFSWSGVDWSEICTTVVARIPQLSDDGILFVGDGLNSAADVWRLPASGDRLEYSLGERSAGFPVRPLWQLPQGLTQSWFPVAGRGSDLLLMIDHAKAENIVNEEKLITSTRILPRDGYHASLLYFSSNYAQPQKLFLRFDDIGAAPPVSGRVARGPMLPSSSAAWLCVGNDRLYLGSESFNTTLSGARMGDLLKTGVWVVSLEQLDQEIARQKASQKQRRAQTATATQKGSKQLLERFDQNRDGQIDGEEKESALADKDFVASQLDQIDANQNGWIDVGELIFFDANGNKKLDANEQVGMECALNLFATQLVRNFDRDGNGLLDRREFSDAFQSGPGSRSGPMMGNSFFDDNHDGQIDVTEIQALGRFQIGQGISGLPFALPMMSGGISGSNAKQGFKEQVEKFWQKGGTNSVRNPNRPGLARPAVPMPTDTK